MGRIHIPIELGAIRFFAVVAAKGVLTAMIKFDEGARGDIRQIAPEHGDIAALDGEAAMGLKKRCVASESKWPGSLWRRRQQRGVVGAVEIFAPEEIIFPIDNPVTAKPAKSILPEIIGFDQSAGGVVGEVAHIDRTVSALAGKAALARIKVMGCVRTETAGPIELEIAVKQLERAVRPIVFEEKGFAP